MSIDRFQTRFKTRSDLMDQITPNNVVQKEVSVPAGEWKPADWLPVIWQNTRSKDYFVMSSGKIVSFFADGRIVPSGLLARASSAANIGAEIIKYGEMDVAARVVDIRTGKFVVEADMGTVTLEDFVIALRDHGFIAEDHPAFVVAGLQDFKDAVSECISSPVGVLAYDVFVWAGEPGKLHFTNYQKQHLIQFFTDIQMKVPHVAVAGGSFNFAGASVITGAQLAAKARYAGLPVSELVAVQVDLPHQMANNTTRTPLSWAGIAGTVRERSGVELLAKEGDWFLDVDAATFVFYSAAGAGLALPAQFAAATVDYFVYTNAVSSTERMIHFVGAGRPGDYLTFDANSNFQVMANSELADAFVNGGIVGRLLAIQKEPRDLLERVRTAFQGEEFDASSKMPGSATRGFSDLITLSKEKVADQIAVINVKIV